MNDHALAEAVDARDEPTFPDSVLPHRYQSNLAKVPVRQLCVERMGAALSLAADRILATASPGELQRIEREVMASVRATTGSLLARKKSPVLVEAWCARRDIIPSDWPPPVAATEPRWADHELRGTRWAAAMFAFDVHTRLGRRWPEHVSGDRCGLLAKALRDAAYETLLATEAVVPRLCYYVLSFARMAAILPFPLPAVAG